MSIHEIAAVIAVVILVLLMFFQLLLAAGFPLGRAAWGGKHRVLPSKYRLLSLAAVIILGLAGWIILARAGLVPPGPEPAVLRVATWVFAVYMALNTLGNISSKSLLEKRVMTPASLILMVCFVLVALS
jgi:hypothetical protein